MGKWHLVPMGEICMSEIVSYTCVDCLSKSDVSNEHHNDERIYIECECGERCAPTNSDEIQHLLRLIG